ncbi:trafficking protein particle complex subunit 2-like protein [Folsomia candida]|nr:trafficking protein particle complex subunit 2-like protein [Folsomia candida]
MTDLQYSFIVSSALDIVEERVQMGHQAFKGGNPALAAAGGVALSSGDGPQVATRELYLGALTAQEEYKVYGYMTNTKIKFVIIVEETSIPLRENDIRMMFRRLHGAFCDLMSNPFYLPGTEIHSKRFEGTINAILAGQ